MITKGNLLAALSGVCLALIAGCADAGGGRISFALHAAGTASNQAQAGVWNITFDEAALAFGPLWLCAADGEQASCETARAEYLDAAIIDLLDPSSHELGEVTGTEGFVGSFGYDYGFVSLLTDTEPLALPAAQALEGSVRLVGRATKGTREVEFTAVLSLSQSEVDIEPGVPVVRRASEDARHVIDQNTTRLDLRFDPAVLVKKVDFELLSEQTNVVISQPATPQNAQAVAALRLALQNEAVPALQWQ